MCQKFSDQQCDSLALSKMSGLKPGFGSSDTKRDSDEELPMNGNLEQLVGQKGSGPSLSKVEEAESGSGVSSGKVSKKAKDFSKQLESFTERDDVPEELKQGVKEYFKNIHATDE